MTTVPFSITAPDTVTTRAFVIANVPARPVLFCCEPSLWALAENKPPRHRVAEKKKQASRLRFLFINTPRLRVSAVKCTFVLIGYLRTLLRLVLQFFSRPE